MQDEKQYKQLTAKLTLPRLLDDENDMLIVEEGLPTMPYWWDGDEEASTSSMAAMKGMEQ